MTRDPHEDRGQKNGVMVNQQVTWPCKSPNHRMTLIGRQIAPPAKRYLVISVALVAVRACFRVRRGSTRTSTDGPPGSSVNPSRLYVTDTDSAQGSL